MDAKVHVLGTLEASSVELHVGVKHLVGRLVVALVFGPAFQHRFRAEVC